MPEEKSIKIKKSDLWKYSTFVLLAVVIIMGVMFFRGTGQIISEDEAAEDLMNYLSSAGYSGFEVQDIQNLGSVYEIDTSYQGQEIPFYVTKEGYFIGNYLVSIIPKDSSSSSTSIPKSDKPKVELFIWSYCPYGVQAQGPFAEVASLLENKADFNVVLYYDGHGDHETQQNKIQACIQEIDKDKYWDYASRFVEEIYPVCGASRDIECNEEESIKLMDSLGINSNSIMSCVESQGESLLSAASSRANEVGVTGSPTLVINGVKASPSSRTAEAFKDSICSAFNNAPQECNTELDSTTSTTSGNC